ncbi:hypothetical protein ACIPVK_17310 [Paeniglutamicibacter sp. MACA_103]|uniref:hypothetical protein n=1 Tax=Paeniglutamicibacter sp. MACA_103 TaxID=3377337 RepID=UPI003892F1BD
MMNQPAPKPVRPAIQRRPVSVLLISALLVLEGLAVLFYALTYAMALGKDGDLGMGARIFMLLLITAAGAWQLLVAHHFFRARAWTRAAALMWQVFQIILAIPYFQSGDALMAWLWLVPAALIVVLLFDPRTTAFLGDRPSPDAKPGS